MLRPLAATPFRCDVLPDREAAHVVASGELDLATAPVVHEQLVELRDAGFRRLVLDLRRTTFMDVSGLRLVLWWTAQVQADGLTAFQVIPGPRAVQRVFALTGTASLVRFIEPHGDDVAPDEAGDGLVLLLDGAIAGGMPLSERLVTLCGQALARSRGHRDGMTRSATAGPHTCTGAPRGV